MAISNVQQLIELHEGRVDHAYQDSLGYWTIGVGHLIDRRKGGKLPDHIIDALRDWDIDCAKKELYKALPWVAVKLDPVRQAVLIDMCFNLGPEPFDGDGFKDWPKFVRAVELGEYGVAAQHMKNSLWHSQVGERAVRLEKMMETGKWP